MYNLSIENCSNLNTTIHSQLKKYANLIELHSRRNSARQILFLLTFILAFTINFSWISILKRRDIIKFNKFKIKSNSKSHVDYMCFRIVGVQIISVKF